MPAHAQAGVKATYWAVADTDGLDTEPGPNLVRLVQARIDRFAEHYRAVYPAAVRCLLADRQQLIVYLRFPVEHHRRIWHSNFIERTFGDTRHRVNVIGRLPGEASCLSLAWAVLDRASRGWRGFTMTASGLRLLHELGPALFDLPAHLRPETPSKPKPANTETIGAVA